jgi:hypothetical protein
VQNSELSDRQRDRGQERGESHDHFGDARKGTIVLDVNENEISDFISKGTRQARRGRRPKATSA